MSERTFRARMSQVGFGLSPSVRETQVTLWLLIFHIATVLVVVTPVVSEFTSVRAAFVFVDLTFVPGVLFLIALDEFEVRLERVLYAMGVSLVLMMGVGVVLNLTLPPVGVDEPLGVPSLVFGTTLLVGSLGAVAYRRATIRDSLLDLHSVFGRQLTPGLPFLLLLVPGMILAVSALEVRGQNGPVLVALTILALIPVGVTLVRRFEWHAIAVWTISLSLLFHVTLFPSSSGGSSVPLHIMDVKQWNPGIGAITSETTSLVPNGVLFPAFATLIDIPFGIQTSYVNSILVSLIPLILYAAYRESVSNTVALLGAAVFMFAHPFYRLYPGGGRVATPVIFLALIGLLIADDRLESIPAHVLAILFAAGLTVSHYGTSYFAMIAFCGAAVSLATLPYLEEWMSGSVGGLRSQVSDRVQVTTDRDTTNVITASFVLFVGVLVLTWYMYTNGGNHFSLPRHVARSVNALFEAEFFGTSTANRVTKSYGPDTPSIRYSRFVYIGLIGLMGVGLASEALRRFRQATETTFDDEFLAIAGIFLATAGSSFVLPVGWGGGRPMMIAFTFSAVFAAVGVIALSKLGFAAVGRIRGDNNPVNEGLAVRMGQSTFAAILVVFLLLNTGALAATAIGGIAPSNVPVNTNLANSENPDFHARAHSETAIETHAWVLDHRGEGVGFRGDLITNGQTDKYRSSIARAMEKDVVFPYETEKPEGFLNGLDESRQTEYVYIMSHNLNLGVYTVNSSYERRSLEPLRDELEARSIIYSTGDSAIYYGGNGTATRNANDERQDG